MSLYKDDGVIILPKVINQQLEKIQKKIRSICTSIVFEKEFTTNLREIDILHVVFNVERHTYLPCKKLHYNLVYISFSSNHHSHIMKDLTQTVSERLPGIFSNAKLFEQSKPDFHEILEK